MKGETAVQQNASNSCGNAAWKDPMNKYSRIMSYIGRSESFANRTASLLKRMQFEEVFSNEVADLQDRILGAGVEDEEVCDQVIDFSSSLTDGYMVPR
jgi:hypothetical protein